MIARLDVPTVDGRTLLRAYWLPPLPVMSIRRQMPIGVVEGLRMVEEGADRYIFAVGWVEVDGDTEGRYGVGVDLGDTDDMGVASNDGTRFVIAGGNIMGLTVYDDGESEPAWPDCHIQILI